MLGKVGSNLGLAGSGAAVARLARGRQRECMYSQFGVGGDAGMTMFVW